MGKFYSELVAALFLCLFLSVSETSESVCKGDAGRKHQTSLTINSVRNERDEWVTKISASQNASVKPKNLDVDFTRSAIDCDENYYINVQGILRDNAEKKPSLIPNFEAVLEENAEKSQNGSLTLHPACSSNVVITNNSRTLQKLLFFSYTPFAKRPRHGSAMTNRPLRDNEIFTVRIDDLVSESTDAIGIGVTTHVPGTFEVPEHFGDIGTGTWMFYDKYLHYKYKAIHSVRDWKIKVGQRIGVMRSDAGALHIFLDGVDKGPAASNIPENVYGVLECYNVLGQGTIVNA